MNFKFTAMCIGGQENGKNIEVNEILPTILFYKK